MQAPLRTFFVTVFGAVTLLHLLSVSADAAKPETPKIENLIPLHPQPHEGDENVIWYDDFNGEIKEYGESDGALSDQESLGGSGRSMISHYEKGSRGAGNRKVFFGDSPTGRIRINRGQKYEEIYWRIYLKHQYGWTGGGPDKLSRATSMVNANWAQAMIAHVWSSGETLTLDPATGVLGDRVVTERYNDFDHLRWLGNKPTAKFKLHSMAESGRWVCVEAHARLNTPGQKDGTQNLWIDGRLETQRTGLDWRGTYTAYGVNAVFLESYWNDGSPVTQSRWIDHFVISSQPIGPVVCPLNPTLMKMEYHGEGEQKGWEMELASDDQGLTVVWKSNFITDGNRVTVDGASGEYRASLAGKKALEPDTIYYTRVRQQNTQDEWSDWSAWHQPFRTAMAANQINEWNNKHENQ